MTLSKETKQFFAFGIFIGLVVGISIGIFGVVR